MAKFITSPDPKETAEMFLKIIEEKRAKLGLAS